MKILFFKLLFFYSLRIVGLHCDDLPCFNITYNNNFIEQYKKLLISEPIREEPGSDIIIPGIESPKFLILDVCYIIIYLLDRYSPPLIPSLFLQSSFYITHYAMSALSPGSQFQYMHYNLLQLPVFCSCMDRST